MIDLSWITSDLLWHVALVFGGPISLAGLYARSERRA